MVKYLPYILMIFSIFSCSREKRLERRLYYLAEQAAELHRKNNELAHTNAELQTTADKLKTEIRVLEIYKTGRPPQYILTFRLKQSRISLDLMEHFKDGMNAITFELPVDEDFYNTVKVGTTVTDQFRTGSFILKGSFSNWTMKVIDKNIK